MPLPFNGSGSFALAEPAFVPNTTISSAAVNSDLSDIADGLSICMTTDGQSQMSAQFKAFAGTVTVPGYSFATDPNTGIYRVAADNLGLSCGGVKALDITSTGVTVPGTLAVTGVATFTAAPVFTADGWLTLADMASLTHGRVIARTSAGDGAPQAAIIPMGQAQLAKSGSNLVLSPFNGNLLTIDSAIETIPDAGVSLSPPATSGTLYFVYASMNAGTMTLEASETVPAVQAGTGVRIKTGDGTRSLVGMARTVSSAWVDTTTQRFVRSWFNDKEKYLLGAFTAERSTVSTTYVEINTEIRIEFLIWENEVIEISGNGGVQTNGVRAGPATAIAIDGTVQDAFTSCYQPNVPVAGDNIFYPMSVTFYAGDLSQGHHYATLFGKQQGGNTGYWFGGSTVGFRTTLSARIK